MATLSEAAALLQAGQDITILCHRSPDGDTLGSGYGLGHALARLGKRVRICCADPIPPQLLPLLPPPPSFAGDEQFVVAVDIADEKLLGTLQERYAGRVDLCIDHHKSNCSYAKATYLLPEAAATAELMAGVIEALGVPLDREIATCLYIGIATDTGCFRYASATANTLRVAAALVEQGIDHGEINRLLFDTKSARRVAAECEALQSLEYCCDQRCAVMSIPLMLLERHGLADDELEGMAALPRQIEGVCVGVTIREQPDHCRVSVRSSHGADASAICAAFGGGGHLRAGGCSVRGTLAEVKKRLVDEVCRQLGCEDCG